MGIDRKPSVRESGFALVEMMIAASLITVIAAIAMPHFLKARRESQIAEAKSQVEILSTAILQLAWDTGKLPNEIDRTTLGNEECWDLTVARAGLLRGTSKFPGWQGPYIAKIPLDPWGSPYFFDPDYRVAGKDVSVVGSFGPNRLGRNRYDSDDIIAIVRK